MRQITVILKKEKKELQKTKGALVLIVYKFNFISY